MTVAARGATASDVPHAGAPALSSGAPTGNDPAAAANAALPPAKSLPPLASTPAPGPGAPTTSATVASTRPAGESPLPLLLGAAALALAVAALVLVGLLWARARKPGAADLAAAKSAKAIKAVRAEIAGLERRLDDTDERLGRLLQAERARGVAPPGPLPEPSPTSDDATPGATRIPGQAATRRVASPPPPMQIAEQAVVAFRAAASEATHAAFARWTRDFVAQGAELTHDGRVSRIPDAANAFAAIVQTSDDTALLFPGGPIVTDFSTRYQQLLTMRHHLGAAFDLETGGGGVLILRDPARLTRLGTEWTVSAKGGLAGLSG